MSNNEQELNVRVITLQEEFQKQKRKNEEMKKEYE